MLHKSSSKVSIPIKNIPVIPAKMNCAYHERPMFINANWRGPMINLTRLPANKRPQVWAAIKEHNQPLAKLLKSDEFNQHKSLLAATFGPIELSVDARAIGGNEYGL